MLVHDKSTNACTTTCALQMLPSKGHKISTCARTSGLLHDRKRHKQVSWISLFLCQLTALDTTACSSAFPTRCPRWQLPRPRQVVAQARPDLSATHPSRGSPCCSERSTIFSHNAGLRCRGTVSSTIFLTAWATGLCHAGGDGLYDTKEQKSRPGNARNAPPVPDTTVERSARNTHAVWPVCGMAYAPVARMWLWQRLAQLSGAASCLLENCSSNVQCQRPRDSLKAQSMSPSRTVPEAMRTKWKRTLPEPRAPRFHRAAPSLECAPAHPAGAARPEFLRSAEQSALHAQARYCSKMIFGPLEAVSMALLQSSRRQLPLHTASRSAWKRRSWQMFPETLPAALSQWALTSIVTHGTFPGSGPKLSAFFTCSCRRLQQLSRLTSYANLNFCKALLA